MKPVEIIEIDDKTRIAVYLDTDAESPLTWGTALTEDSFEYKQWAKGEVYGVVIEQRVDYYELDDNGVATDRPCLEVWEETGDSLWGCYLDDTYTAEMVAKEYFGVEKKEQA